MIARPAWYAVLRLYGRPWSEQAAFAAVLQFAPNHQVSFAAFDEVRGSLRGWVRHCYELGRSTWTQRVCDVIISALPGCQTQPLRYALPHVEQVWQRDEQWASMELLTDGSYCGACGRILKRLHLYHAIRDAGLSFLLLYQLTSNMSNVTRIGYYNHNGHPVLFPVRGASIELLPGQPIVDPKGNLVPNDVDLEAEVKLGTIKHCLSNDKRFNTFNGRAAQAETVIISAKQTDGFPAGFDEAREAAARAPQKPKRVVSAQVGAVESPKDVVASEPAPASNVLPAASATPVEEPKASNVLPAAALVEEVQEIGIDDFIAHGRADGSITMKGNNIYIYDGHEFKSKNALLVYVQKQQEVAA